MDVARTAELNNRELARRLQKAGLRATRPRLLILQLLRDSGGHRSADDLVAELQNQGTPLPRASVYGVLGALLSHGLLILSDIGHGRALYELAERRHHHFVCRTCGAIQDVLCLVEREPCLDSDHSEQVDGTVDEAQVILRGYCSDCLEKVSKK
jgi:Fur family ferric uptake transcriptional regulator